MASRVNVPGLLFLAALALVWEVWARKVHSPNFPGFTDVLAALVENHAEIGKETAFTLQRALSGFAIALVTMLPLGVFLVDLFVRAGRVAHGRSPRVQSARYCGSILRHVGQS